MWLGGQVEKEFDGSFWTAVSRSRDLECLWWWGWCGVFRCFLNRSGYGSIPINTIFRGMNIHLPAILMFTRGTRFWHTAIWLWDVCLYQIWLFKSKESPTQISKRVKRIHVWFLRTLMMLMAIKWVCQRVWGMGPNHSVTGYIYIYSIYIYIIYIHTLHYTHLLRTIIANSDVECILRAKTLQLYLTWESMEKEPSP